MAKLKGTTTDSHFICMIMILCGHLGISKSMFHKVMINEREMKTRVKIERVKSSNCYRVLKSAFDKMIM